jgi:DNA replication protein DnaC
LKRALDQQPASSGNWSARLLVWDELACASPDRGRVELLLRVYAGRCEPARVLVTNNLPFGESNQISQGEPMTVALLDRLTHNRQVFEMKGERHRLGESMKDKNG